MLLITLCCSLTYASWEWMDFADAYEKAMEENKHLVVNFYSIGCYWCRKMDNDTFADSTVMAKLDEDFLGAKVNIGSNREVMFDNNKITERQLAQIFRVRGTPNTAFVDTTGKVILGIPGYVSVDKFAMVLDYISGFWYNDLSFNEYVISGSIIEKEDEDK